MDLEESLRRRTKTQLVNLIKTMLAREPGLRDLLGLPSAGEGKTVNTEDIRRRAQRALHPRDLEYRSFHAVASGLDSLAEVACQHLEAGEVASAVAVYSIVVEEILATEEWIWDDDGATIAVTNEITAGLGRSLDTTADRETRQRALGALFSLLKRDFAIGGIGIADGVAGTLSETSSAEERAMLQTWVEERVAEAGEGSYELSAWGRVLLELQADMLDDEDYLEVCRSTGRIIDLVERLLYLGRSEDAAEASKGTNDYSLLRAADLFIEHGLQQQAIDLVSERALESSDRRLKEWLRAAQLGSGNPEDALALALELFREGPSPDGYEEVCDIADRLGRRGELKDMLLAELEANTDQTRCLIRVLLEEGELDRAYGHLAASVPKRSDLLWIAFAEEAEDDRPEVALEVYRERAEWLIEQRGRRNYRDACVYLRKTKRLHRAIGKEQEWSDYLEELRSRERRLSALQQELDAASL